MEWTPPGGHAATAYRRYSQGDQNALCALAHDLFGEAGVKYILKIGFVFTRGSRDRDMNTKKNAGLAVVIVSVSFHLLDLLWRALHAI